MDSGYHTWFADHLLLPVSIATEFVYIYLYLYLPGKTDPSHKMSTHQYSPG